VGGAARDLFGDVYFAVIPSPALDEPTRKKVSGEAYMGLVNVTDGQQYIKLLKDHGATHLDLSSSKLKNITHIIASDSNFEAYNDAIDALIPVVTTTWIDHALDKKKAPNPKTYCPDPGHYFHDVIVSFAEDIPQGDKDAITGGIQAMGGQVCEPLTKLVTHVVALSMKNQKTEVMVAKKVKAIAVLPHWFDHCLKLGRKLSTVPYILPEPPLLTNGGFEKPGINYTASKALDGNSTMVPDGDPIPSQATDEAIPTRSVFRNLALMLHDDLDISTRLVQTLTDIVTSNGGRVVSTVDETDYLICHYRDSDEYFQAARAGKDVGNLNWLYFLINRNTYSSPMTRLLHYPYIRGGIDGFANAKITISNFTGEARIFLDNLIKAAGGQFTKTMTQDNTYLIAAHMQSEKCAAAQDWNINIVNHLWLEESYAAGVMKAPTTARYTFFPPRNNLTELVGQTAIDRDALKKVLHTESESGGSRHATPGAKSTGNAQKRRSAATPRALDLGQENTTPGSRGAKDRAIHKLSRLAPDIAAYEKEKKRVGGVVYGGRKVNDPERIKLDSNGHSKKRSIDEAETEAGEDDDELAGSAQPESPVPKKQKKEAKSKAATKTNGTVRNTLPKLDPEQYPNLYMLLTGLDHDTVRSVTPTKFSWPDLNIHMVETLPSKPDVIVSRKIMRTPKFLAGLANVPVVVGVEWLEAMKKQGERLPPEDFTLEDKAWEKNTGHSFADVLQRAEEYKSRGGMLAGCKMHFTLNVKGGKELASIVEAHGGEAILWTSSGRLNEKEDAEEGREPRGRFDPDTAMLISEPADKALWKRFKKDAQQGGYIPSIISSEWILAMTTVVDFDVTFRKEWELDG
jgi:hypothetical protein